MIKERTGENKVVSGRGEKKVIREVEGEGKNMEEMRTVKNAVLKERQRREY